MISNRSFYWALFVSLLIHVLFFVGLSITKAKEIATKKKVKTLEVTYQKIKTKTVVKKEEPIKDLKLVEKPKIKPRIDVPTRRVETLPTLDKPVRDVSKMMKGVRTDRGISKRIQTLDLHRKITVPVVKSEKITNPKYLSYNQDIRQKIRNRAYAYIDHPDFEAGEVYLTFILSANGELIDVKIIEDKTKANDYLRRTSMRCVKEASPFTSFPKDLKYPELTFNVIISFEVE